MPSVRVRNDTGLLFFDFRWKGARYREQTALTDSPANRARLERVIAKIRSQMAAGTFEYERFFQRQQAPIQNAITNKRLGGKNERVELGQEPTASPEGKRVPTFRDFTAQWIREHSVEWRRSHLRTLRSTIDGHLLPRFGDAVVSDINKSDIFAFRSELASQPGRRPKTTLSNKRINGIIGPLKQIVNEAADRFEFASPVANLKPLKVRRSDVFPFTLDEVGRILASVRADYHDYLLTRFFTGMRSGEVDGLKWKYVDFERRLILVRETLVLGEDDYTKTDGSQRDIQISVPVYDALCRQHKSTGNLSGYVFCNREGNAVDNKNFTERVWAPLMRHLNLSMRRPYQMRHTAATLWLAAGESPEWIARQLGHTSTQMLFKIYSRYVPNLTRQDGSAMERLLRSTFHPPLTSGGASNATDQDS